MGNPRDLHSQKKWKKLHFFWNSKLLSSKSTRSAFSHPSVNPKISSTGNELSNVLLRFVYQKGNLTQWRWRKLHLSNIFFDIPSKFYTTLQTGRCSTMVWIDCFPLVKSKWRKNFWVIIFASETSWIVIVEKKNRKGSTWNANLLLLQNHRQNFFLQFFNQHLVCYRLVDRLISWNEKSCDEFKNWNCDDLNCQKVDTSMISLEKQILFSPWLHARFPLSLFESTMYNSKQANKEEKLVFGFLQWKLDGLKVPKN